MKNIALRMAKSIINLGILICIIFFCIYIGRFAFNYAYDIANQPSAQSRSVKEIEVRVEKGSTTKEIAKLLEEKGLIRNALWFELKSRYYNMMDSLKKAILHCQQYG